ncbi:hypothetical protein [Amycolatopsis aidingensis]|uniref:hypothetical protein n=1 Tax=Amycolatopsis aidingensis TaxID=2842453 RepID=UPI001C0E8BF1|nr:hypothetical protein [Amycolatopsis aidingensis]
MNFRADPASIDGSSHLLAEVAGLLREGRLDGDNCVAAKAPRSHPDVGKKVEEFARFADDQFQDLVALLGALSTKLTAAGQALVSVDQNMAARLDRFLTGTYVPPEKR